MESEAAVPMVRYCPWAKQASYSTEFYPNLEMFWLWSALQKLNLLSGQVSDVGVPSVEIIEPRRTRSELNPPSSAPSEKTVSLGVKSSATVQPNDHMSISPP